MTSLHFESAWKAIAAEDLAQVKSMWREYRAIDSEDVMERRSKEIVYILKNEIGAVAGVSTTRVVQAKFLNNHFFYEFRCFIAPPFRRPGLDTHLAVKTKSFLEGLEGSGTKIKGMVMIIQNQDIKNHRTKAVWPSSEMVFAGYTPEGHHIRVGYFKGARI